MSERDAAASWSDDEVARTVRRYVELEHGSDDVALLRHALAHAAELRGR